jgi:hypothetical protein
VRLPSELRWSAHTIASLPPLRGLDYSGQVHFSELLRRTVQKFTPMCPQCGKLDSSGTLRDIGRGRRHDCSEANSREQQRQELTDRRIGSQPGDSGWLLPHTVQSEARDSPGSRSRENRVDHFRNLRRLSMNSDAKSDDPHPSTTSGKPGNLGVSLPRLRSPMTEGFTGAVGGQRAASHRALNRPFRQSARRPAGQSVVVTALRPRPLAAGPTAPGVIGQTHRTQLPAWGGVGCEEAVAEGEA